MSYAVRKDGAGLRAVAGPQECGPDEDYSATLPAPLPPTPWQLRQEAAKVAMSATDGLVSRILEAVLAGDLQINSPDVRAFMGWRRAMGAAAKAPSGDPLQPLPARPSAPPGL